MHVLVILFAGARWIKPTKSRRLGMGTKGVGSRQQGGRYMGCKGTSKTGLGGIVEINQVHWM